MKKIYTVTFSPTGTSKMVAGLISSAFDGEKIDIDLCMEKNRKLTADGDDLCVFSLPCYGGRVPHTAAERLAGICGQSTPAIICVTFGNRDFEDSLLELSDIVSENGFRVISACADNISRMISGKEEWSTGVKVTRDKENSPVIDISVVADYGSKIPQLEWDIQTAVKDNVFKISGERVSAVNIHVQGVTLAKNSREKK